MFKQQRRQFTVSNKALKKQAQNPLVLLKGAKIEYYISGFAKHLLYAVAFSKKKVSDISVN
jgi:hypothetical protein